MKNSNKKIVITGGAGLVGQNLIARLFDANFKKIIAIDKHRSNLDKLKKHQPEVEIYCADLSESGQWTSLLRGADCIIILHAQIGGVDLNEFTKNNIISTKLVLKFTKLYKIKRVIHISSSVINSSSNDYYTNTKREQESLVQKARFNSIILRPTLMFGWFDRKHLGWLHRFMGKFYLFPIPGLGKYIRQPLYVGDLCEIIIKSIKNDSLVGVYNISGLEKIYYINIIKEIKKYVAHGVMIIYVPCALFYLMLKLWEVFDGDPPFTTQQLQALINGDEFEGIDWPKVFNIKATSFKSAISETFTNPKHSTLILDF
jgi:nucleoside-diphosphate-sugar epimerase